MHEYSLVRNLLDRVDAEVRGRHGRRVTRVWIRIGELAGVDAGLLRSAYDMCRPGTACAGAALDITAVGAEWVCDGCGGHVAPAGPRRCAACGAPARLVAGDDLVLERFELEVDDV